MVEKSEGILPVESSGEILGFATVVAPKPKRDVNDVLQTIGKTHKPQPRPVEIIKSTHKHDSSALNFEQEVQKFLHSKEQENRVYGGFELLDDNYFGSVNQAPNNADAAEEMKQRTDSIELLD